MEKLSIEGLDCLCCHTDTSSRIAYVLYPLDGLSQWAAQAAESHNVTIVVITGMDWDNDLTPWPAPGVPKGAPDFKGLAPEFLKKLTQVVASQIEERYHIDNAERTLVGVSLSGLFTLWQWPQSTFFSNVATLSGSYWYEGFVQWLCSQSFVAKKGKCYMLLGQEEPKAANPVFRTVGKCTHEVVAYLRAQGVNVTFDMVPGNHYQYGIDRLDKAFAHLFPT